MGVCLVGLLFGCFVVLFVGVGYFVFVLLAGGCGLVGLWCFSSLLWLVWVNCCFLFWILVVLSVACCVGWVVIMFWVGVVLWWFGLWCGCGWVCGVLGCGWSVCVDFGWLSCGFVG